MCGRFRCRILDLIEFRLIGNGIDQITHSVHFDQCVDLVLKFESTDIVKNLNF